MAGIDKTYINGKDYINYRNWWIENYNKMKSELGKVIHLYTFDVFTELNITPEFLENNTEDIEFYKTMWEFPIWNTSEKEDIWLIKYCNIESFRNRMLECYDSKWKGFKNQNWAKPNKKPQYKR